MTLTVRVPVALMGVFDGSSVPSRVIFPFSMVMVTCDAFGAPVAGRTITDPLGLAVVPLLDVHLK
jgi:hypothetical protein